MKAYLHFFCLPSTGLCALSINHSNSFLAYPGSATIGEVIVYDANSLVRNRVVIVYADDTDSFPLPDPNISRCFELDLSGTVRSQGAETGRERGRFGWGVGYRRKTNDPLLLFQNTVTMIPAHDSPLAALTFNASATRLASASERVRRRRGGHLSRGFGSTPHWLCVCVCLFQGTVIRVFSVPEGSRLFEFRRGMKRSEVNAAVPKC